jgi:ABC-2 type transport system ATP-binding protein
MTTHYMEEAEQLCDRIAIIDQGRLLAEDTPKALVARAPGGTLIELTLDAGAEPLVTPSLQLAGVSSVDARGNVLRAYSECGGQVIPALIAVAEGAARSVTNIHLASPNLETLFISLTGRKLD